MEEANPLHQINFIPLKGQVSNQGLVLMQIQCLNLTRQLTSRSLKPRPGARIVQATIPGRENHPAFPPAFLPVFPFA